MKLLGMISLAVSLQVLTPIARAAGLPISVNSAGSQVVDVNTTSNHYFSTIFNLTDAPPSLKSYPGDPYLHRVTGTTISLIFFKYGSLIDITTFYRVIAGAQYNIVQHMSETHGDGPVPYAQYDWGTVGTPRLRVAISRPMAVQELTWLMIASALEGLREFFEEWGYFETEVTLLDDEKGVVGSGSVKYVRA